jgi:DNA topoisomerase-1
MIGDPLQEIRERDCSAPAVPDTDPVAAAKSAGLCYVGDGMPGIRRKRNGKAFTYFASDGKALRDPDEIRRIKSLVIPPAWTDVWICPISNGHIRRPLAT